MLTSLSSSPIKFNEQFDRAYQPCQGCQKSCATEHPSLDRRVHCRCVRHCNHQDQAHNPVQASDLAERMTNKERREMIDEFDQRNVAKVLWRADDR